MLEIKQLVKLGVEEGDRITKKGMWLPSGEEWKNWVLCTALSSASLKMDLVTMLYNLNLFNVAVDT